MFCRALHFTAISRPIVSVRSRRIVEKRPYRKAGTIDAMKAAVLKSFGSPLVVENVPEPVLGTGEVIVDVAAAKVLAYAGEVFSGKRNYLLTPPVIPGSGGIGRVRSFGPDATALAVGDWVLCDPTVRSRDTAVAPTIVRRSSSTTMALVPWTSLPRVYAPATPAMS